MKVELGLISPQDFQVAESTRKAFELRQFPNFEAHHDDLHSGEITGMDLCVGGEK